MPADSQLYERQADHSYRFVREVFNRNPQVSPLLTKMKREPWTWDAICAQKHDGSDAPNVQPMRQAAASEFGASSVSAGILEEPVAGASPAESIDGDAEAYSNVKDSIEARSTVGLGLCVENVLSSMYGGNDSQTKGQALGSLQQSKSSASLQGDRCSPGRNGKRVRMENEIPVLDIDRDE